VTWGTTARAARVEWAGVIGCMALLAMQQSMYAGYVKDDTFISLRYARNFVDGHGLVFNPGERVEGYTNFLWVMLATPAFVLKLDPVDWVKALSVISSHGALLLSWALARFFAGDRMTLTTLLAPLFWAVSPSVALWSQAGLEPPLMAALASGGVLLAMRVLCRETADPPFADTDARGSAILLAFACLGRPDAHAVALVVAAFAGLDALRRRAAGPWFRSAAWIAGIVLPYHALRVAYFGDLLPNTFYVKAAAGPEVWKRGIDFVGELLGFAANPVLFGLAAVAVLLPGRRAARALALALVGAFLLYLVKIGRDEMKWFRLFLPVYPLVLALAADSLRQVVEGLSRPRPAFAPALSAVALAALAPVARDSIEFARANAKKHDAYRSISERSFADLGRYVADRSEPGTSIAFQDMGAAPFAGADLIWIDTIGLVDRTVARELAKRHINPFMKSERASAPGGGAVVREYEAAVRDYVFGRDPRWIAFVAYPGKGQRRDFDRALREGTGPDDPSLADVFLPAIRGNSHAQGIPRDARFAERYRFERVWKRNDAYWLVLYQRRPDAG
jgi:hypothetical protein